MICSVPYQALAKLFSTVEKISERYAFGVETSLVRNKMISLTANYFRSVIATTPQDLLPSVYLILNQVAPTFKGVELGVGDGIIVKSLQDATGKSS